MTAPLVSELHDLLASPLPGVEAGTQGSWRDGITLVFASFVCLHHALDHEVLSPHAALIRQNHAELVMLIEALEAIANGEAMEHSLQVKMPSGLELTNGEMLKHLVPVLVQCAETLEQLDGEALRLAHAISCTHTEVAVRDIGQSIDKAQLDGLVFLLYDLVDVYNDHPVAERIRKQNLQGNVSGERSH